ncbi:4-alpha-glucanotransferase [Caviibacterium pharyngocola]|uniref:4-alpha-glucanotransferase n=1 Tax=Caviibacterium pharyngocola TaxID=28159 RepID=A0A2M8RYU8_9PAST|nr:4-alpha-glucanotransferase [Caviibacterium pharyngocola]PJG84069.1 4-alpha-glucanotransferase [Caviibacterium pharyngocola]
MSIKEHQMQSAETLGIATSYYDIDGHLIYANPESLDYFTELLQPPNNAGKSELFDDVIVVKENEPIIYYVANLNLPDWSSLHCVVLDENERTLSESTFSFSPSLSLSPLPYGYYALQFTLNERLYRIRILVAPHTAYQPSLFNQKKSWGLNVQLYSLRSSRNWGIGDFDDLRYLIEKSAQFGYDFVGINPLHLLYSSVPEWASPYSSSSRRWLNYLYVAIDSLPEFKLCKSVQNWFNREEIQAQLCALRARDEVDYAAVNRLKMTALEQLFAYFLRSKSAKIIARRNAFAAFVKQQGDALRYQGLFEVLDNEEHDQMPEDENRIGWLGWREKWQHLTANTRKTLLKEHKEKIEFYAWLQWLAYTQLAELQNLCAEVGMKLGIYGDLAVSSSRGSADVWSDQELYCVNASVGAPPDPLGPVGQNWNIPPYNPSVLKARGFQPFVDLLRANMQNFGVLRIDHIMGLFRLWLIPEGKNASDGLYVHYPFDALMAVLAIESQRNQCLVVGEDLGIVPNEVRSKLNELSILSYFVLYFERKQDHYPAGGDFPLNAFATVGTHDVPSLQSFWHCRDLQLFGDLGVLQGDVLKQKYDQRVIDKQALLNTLHRDQYLSSDYWGDALTMAMHDNLNLMIHRYLAESRTNLIGVQLENLLNQEVSFNLPGTSSEYPNWRKKLARNLEDIFNDEYITSFLTEIGQARAK